MSGRVIWVSLIVLFGGCDGGGEAVDAGAAGMDGAILLDGGSMASDAGAPMDGQIALPDAPSMGPEDAGRVDGSAPDAGEMPRIGSCFDPIPEGAAMPAPFPTYDGTCPELMPGLNELTSSDAARELLLVIPDDLGEDEEVPLIFLWHWLGGSPAGFAERGEIQLGANEARFIAVIPDNKGDLRFRWPFLIDPIHSAERRDEELRFFDDMLACVSAQYQIKRHCVSSAGVSAGGLFTPQLAQRRANHLSSIVVLSGGVGWGNTLQPVRPWMGASHAMPALVLWGGPGDALGANPGDFCGIDFDRASRELTRGLADGGHYLIECVHDCNHAQPPIDVPEGVSAFAPFWRFVIDHPYWLEDGVSPYQTEGLPEGTPSWCAQGRGSATIRTGECPDEPLGSCS